MAPMYMERPERTKQANKGKSYSQHLLIKHPCMPKTVPGGARGTEVNKTSGIEDSLGGVKSLGFGKLIVSLLDCVTCYS